jgi:NAD(P)-dependent dehydrogenase (short-subunit alcohol dehydrogenase family)
LSSTKFDLTEKIGVIIGGARDLGFDMAEALGDAGCDLVITSRSLDSAEEAAARLVKNRNVEARPFALDVCDYRAVEDLAGTVKDWQGHVDVLINNAGGGLGLTPTAFFERSPEHMKQLIETNMTGTLYTCQAFGKIMVEQGYGKIINIASIAGMVGRDRRMYHRTGLAEQPIEYAASKAGVIGMTQDLAGLLSPKGVYVNAISPGGFERGQPDAFIQAYSDRTPLGRMGRDGIDLKGAALFLASSASDYVTGHNLVVDGGFTLWH